MRTLEEVKQEIRLLVEAGEISEDILVAMEDVRDAEGLEAILDNYC